MHLSLNLHPTPASTSTHKCDIFIFAARPSPPLISSSFLAPSIPLLHQALRAALAPLTPWQRQEVQPQPIGTSFSSLCHSEGEKVKAADRGGGGKQITSFPIPARGGDQTALRSGAHHRLLITSDQTGNLHRNSPVGFTTENHLSCT